MCIALILILNSFLSFYNLAIEYCEHITAAILIVLIVAAITVPTFVLLHPMKQDTMTDDNTRKYLAIGLFMGAVVMGVMLLILFLKTWKRCTKNDNQITATPPPAAKPKHVFRKWHPPDKGHLFGDSQSWDNQTYDSSIDLPSEVRHVIDETRSADNRKSIEVLAAASKKIVKKLKALPENSKSSDSQDSSRSNLSVLKANHRETTSSITVIAGGNVRLPSSQAAQDKVLRNSPTESEMSHAQKEEIRRPKSRIIDRLSHHRTKQKLLSDFRSHSSYGSLEVASAEDEHASMGRFTNFMKLNIPMMNRRTSLAERFSDPIRRYSWNPPQRPMYHNSNEWFQPANEIPTLYPSTAIRPAVTVMSPVPLAPPEAYLMHKQIRQHGTEVQHLQLDHAPTVTINAPIEEQTYTQELLDLTVREVSPQTTWLARRTSYIDSVLFSDSIDLSIPENNDDQRHDIQAGNSTDYLQVTEPYPPNHKLHVRRLKSDPPINSEGYYSAAHSKHARSSLRGIETRPSSTSCWLSNTQTTATDYPEYLASDTRQSCQSQVYSLGCAGFPRPKAYRQKRHAQRVSDTEAYSRDLVQTRHYLPKQTSRDTECSSPILRRHTERARWTHRSSHSPSYVSEKNDIYAESNNWCYWDRKRTRSQPPILAKHPSATTDDSFDFDTFDRLG